MKRQVWKYELGGAQEVCSIQMPKGAEILTVQAQGNGICLWALVDPSAKKELRRFCACYTGSDLDFPYLRYVGTVKFAYLVFHIFEI